MHRRAFTLIEMLVTSVLAAAVMISVLGVTASIRRPPPVAGDENLTGGLAALLEHDLVHARHIMPTADGMRLIGYGCLDPMTARPEHRLTEIVYRIVNEADGASWLVRDQVIHDDRTGPIRSSALVYRGAIKLNADYDRVPLQGIDTEIPDSWFDPVPDRVGIQVLTGSKDEPTTVFDRLIRIR